MNRTDKKYAAYLQILKEELVPAMGCTEPIAIAYAAARAKKILGNLPDKVEIGVSDNIIKNVKSVIVLNTDGLKGIERYCVFRMNKRINQLDIFRTCMPRYMHILKDYLSPLHRQFINNFCYRFFVARNRT